jgi:hypothetical protein
VFRLELANFQIDGNEQSQSPVEEQEIDEILLASDFQAVLASNERKYPSHFQKEWLYFGEDRLFQLALAVLVGKLQEVECVFVFDCKLRLVSNVLWKRNVEVRLIEQRLLVGFVLNLVDQDVFGPAELLRPLKVELALGLTPCTAPGSASFWSS